MTLLEQYDKIYSELKELKDHKTYVDERVKHLEAKQLELAKLLNFACLLDDVN